MGNSVLFAALLWSMSVHPHVHGELIFGNKYPGLKSGSSPRAWGTRGAIILIQTRWRFIPTCMGNSSTPRSRYIENAVHPHVHGELNNFSPSNLINIGSSPRAWGTHLHMRVDILNDRFIPTCMGNSGSVRGVVCRITVHPHVHGELWRKWMT